MHRTMKIYCLILCIAAMCFTVSAREKLLRHYTTAQGLPANNVYSIYQDARQYMWFGTEAGLCKYDGIHFQNYTERDGLPDKDIMEIFGTPGGNIYAIGYNGKIAFYTGSKFVNIGGDTLRSGLVSGVLPDGHGGNWIWGEKLIDIANATARDWTGAMPMSKDKILQSEVYAKDTLLVFIGNTVYLFSRGKCTALAMFDARLITERALGAFTYGKDGFVFYTRSRIYLFVRQGAKLLLKNIVEPGGRIENIKMVNGKCLVAINGKGLLEYAALTGKPSGDVYVPGSFIGKIYPDREGGLWLAAASNGVYYLSDPEIFFYSIPHTGELKGIRALACRSSGELLLGMDDGRIISKTGAGFKTLQQSSIANNRIVVMKVRGQVLWAGSVNALYRLKPTGPGWEYAAIKATKDIAFTPDTAALLVAAYNGVFLLHTKTRLTDTIYNKRVTAVFEDAKKTLWLGTPEGLWTRDKGMMRRYDIHAQRPLNAHIKNIIGTPGDIKWIVTANKGLVAIENNRQLQVNTDNGLASNICNAAFAEGDSIVWVATANGIGRVSYNPATLQVSGIRNYNQAADLDDNAVNSICIQGDTIWAGTDMGLIGFNKNWQPAFHLHPPVYITSAGSRQQPVLHDRDKLPPGAGDIEFNYIAVSYRNKGLFRYAYRLLGIDTQWRYTISNIVSYNNLHPGAYVFEVTTIEAGGNKGQVARFHFVVRTVFWKTTWFIMGIAVLGIIVIAGCVYWLHRRKLGRERLQRKLVELELAALRAQMDPHFIFNCLNSIEYYFLENNKKQAIFYLGKFSKLLRQTLEFSRCQFITLKEEIDFLHNYIALERMKLDDIFSYTITVGPGIESEAVYVPPLLLQVYVENAIRHGLKNKKDGAGKLSIRFNSFDKILFCEIEDNGVGRVAAGLERNARYHIPLGTHISQARIHLMNVIHSKKITISVIDKDPAVHEGRGLIVQIKMPLYYEQQQNYISHHH